MRNKVLFGLAMALVVTLPLAAAETEAAVQAPDALAQGCLVQAGATTDVTTLDTAVELAPVSFKELSEGFLIPAASFGCGQTGACDTDRNCFWMRSQCPLGTFPECGGGTGSGCDGTCNCAW